MAHYHMGGVRVNNHMETRIDGLYAAGEAVGGANGANRLSGNAITEAFVFGERAGSSAAEAGKHLQVAWEPEVSRGGVRAPERIEEDAIEAMASGRSRFKRSCRVSCGKTPGRFAPEQSLLPHWDASQQMQRDDLPNIHVRMKLCTI